MYILIDILSSETHISYQNILLNIHVSIKCSLTLNKFFMPQVKRRIGFLWINCLVCERYRTLITTPVIRRSPAAVVKSTRWMLSGVIVTVSLYRCWAGHQRSAAVTAPLSVKGQQSDDRTDKQQPEFDHFPHTGLLRSQSSNRTNNQHQICVYMSSKGVLALRAAFHTLKDRTDCLSLFNPDFCRSDINVFICSSCNSVVLWLG